MARAFVGETCSGHIVLAKEHQQRESRKACRGGNRRGQVWERSSTRRALRSTYRVMRRYMVHRDMVAVATAIGIAAATPTCPSPTTSWHYNVIRKSSTTPSTALRHQKVNSKCSLHKESKKTTASVRAHMRLRPSNQLFSKPF